MEAKNLNNSDSTAYEASRIVKVAPGTIFSIIGYNSKTSAQFIQLHDSKTLPANAVAPVLPIRVPAQSNYWIDWGEIGRWCQAGIVVCNSSTGPTKTIGSADCWFSVQYK